jgi:hypothetical protein
VVSGPAGTSFPVASHLVRLFRLATLVMGVRFPPEISGNETISGVTTAGLDQVPKV